MKQFLLFAATVLVTLGTISQAHAKKPNDQEFRRVIVTLKSGEKVDGYVHRGWHADNSLFKKENYSFKITKTPDDKEPIKYTADDVESVEYVEKTEANPDGVRWEAHNIASPGISNRYRTFHRLVCLNKAGQNATTYWWKTWTTERVGNIDRRVLKTIYGIRFHNDPDKIVYPYMFVNSVLMDKQYPGLKDFCKKWFKGPEGKVHKKEAKQNDAWMLDMYDAYLAEQTDK
jgi:hypothetical protein